MWNVQTHTKKILPRRGVNYSVVNLKGISFLIAISHMIKDFKLILYSSYVLQVHSSSNVITQNQFIEGKDHTMSSFLVKG